MSVNLIGSDIKMMRLRYDEALQMQGVPCKYQFPLMANPNNSGDPVVDSYSDYHTTHILSNTLQFQSTSCSKRLIVHY